MSADIIIFIGFLIFTLVFGLVASRGVTNIKEFAVGDRNFSTPTLITTIVATTISGATFFSVIPGVYTQGIVFIVAIGIGGFLGLLLIGIVFAPRMHEFLGKLSVAEAMGDLYGRNVRAITSIAGFIGVAGIIAVQLKMSGMLFKHILGIPIVYGIIISGSIVTLYSSLGGVKSVTFTDVMQFATFSFVIPAIAYFLFNNTESGKIIQTIQTNPLFDYESIFTFKNPQIYYYMYILIWSAIPGFNPASFQRIAMAKNVNQVRSSFIISAFVVFFIGIITSWIGILILSISPNITDNNILKLFLSEYTWSIGFKGLILSGIMAMIMSTVDSYINSTSILLTHDLSKSLNLKFIKKELLSTRVCSMSIGVISILFAMNDGNLLDMVVFSSIFYIPIVTVPFLLAILGFRSTSKSVIIGMLAGLIVALIWEFVIKSIAGNIGGVIPGMLANLMFLTSHHYLFKQKGGWIVIKNTEPIIKARLERKAKFNKLWEELKSFSFIDSCKNNTPKNEGFIATLGFFVMISTFSSITSLSGDTHSQYASILNVVFPIILGLSSALISYPLYLVTWKRTNLINLCWNFTMFFALVCFSFFLVIISNFSEIQLMLFMINIIVIASLSSWKWSLFTIISGASITLFFYKNLALQIVMENDFSSFEFKIIYLLLLITTTLIMLFKPKQEEEERKKVKIRYLEREVDYTQRELDNITQGFDFLEKQLKQKEGNLKEKEVYLRNRIKIRNTEISKLTNMKDEFLRNITHESNAPMTGIISMSEVLYSCYDKLDNKLIKRTIKDIVNSSDRLKTYVNSIVDLSKLSSSQYKLNKEAINLGELAKERTFLYKKVFSDDETKQEFIFNIGDNFIVNCDRYYITQTIDNLISNASNYGRGKSITISIKREEESISFSISDLGIGIPQTELLSIFAKFSTSSKTSTLSSGRGVGLALCKSVIEAHEGIIKATSRKGKGTTFTFTLPCIA